MEQLYCGVSNYSHNFAGEKKIHSIKCNKLHHRLDGTGKWEGTVLRTQGFHLKTLIFQGSIC